MKKIIEGNGAFCVVYYVDTEKKLHILIQKHPERPFWELPGGGLKYGEPFIKGLQREIKEELGLRPYLKDFCLEAVCQQLVPVGEGVFSTGTVMFYSLLCRGTERFWRDRTQLTLHPEEISDIRVVPILQAIHNSQEDNPDFYLGIAFRRLLLMFYKRYLDRMSSRDTSTPFEHSLGQPLTVDLLGQGDPPINL